MRIKLLMTVALAMASISPANAGRVRGANVVGFETVEIPSGRHLVYVFTDGNRTDGTPPCSNPALPNRWALDPTTPMGQATYSLLLTARAQRETIALDGYGGCELAGDAETIIFAATNNVYP